MDRENLPEWGKIYDELRTRLSTGESHASVSIDIDRYRQKFDEVTINVALDFLEAEGLVELTDGEVYQKKKSARSKRKSSFESDYSERGRKPTSEKLDLKISPVIGLSQQIRQIFQNLDEKFVINYKTLQIVDGVPHAISDSYMPYSLFSELYAKLEKQHQSIYTFFEQNAKKPTHKKEVLKVDAPTAEERKLLGILDTNRVNVVRIDGFVYSGNQLVELCLLCDRADLYEFHYDVKM